MSQTPFALLPFPGPPLDGIVAGVTPPVDAAGNPLDLADSASQVENLRAALGSPAPGDAQPREREWQVVSVWQVHGKDVLRVGGGHGPVGGSGPTKADALITDEPGVLLLTRHGDCLPILYWDPVHRAVGLAHSGRRGTLANIAGAVVERMRAEFGSDPGEMIASIGPGVRSCCYSVGEEVVETARGIPGAKRYLSSRDGRCYLDLQGYVGGQLAGAGVRSICGVLDSECTCCGPTRMHSYRRGGSKLRFAAVAGVRR